MQGDDPLGLGPYSTRSISSRYSGNSLKQVPSLSKQWRQIDYELSKTNEFLIFFIRNSCLQKLNLFLESPSLFFSQRDVFTFREHPEVTKVKQSEVDFFFSKVFESKKKKIRKSTQSHTKNVNFVIDLRGVKDGPDFTAIQSVSQRLAENNKPTTSSNVANAHLKKLSLQPAELIKEPGLNLHKKSDSMRNFNLLMPKEEPKKQQSLGKIASNAKLNPVVPSTSHSLFEKKQPIDYSNHVVYQPKKDYHNPVENIYLHKLSPSPDPPQKADLSPEVQKRNTLPAPNSNHVFSFGQQKKVSTTQNYPTDSINLEDTIQHASLISKSKRESYFSRNKGNSTLIPSQKQSIQSSNAVKPVDLSYGSTKKSDLINSILSKAQKRLDVMDGQQSSTNQSSGDKNEVDSLRNGKIPFDMSKCFKGGAKR